MPAPASCTRAPAYGLEDYDSCKKHGCNEEILTPVQGDGVFAANLPFFGGMFVWKANPVIIENSPRRAALRQREIAAQLHALLAPQDADHLPRDDAVVRRHGAQEARTMTARRCATWPGGRRRDQFFPPGAGAPGSDDRQPPDWCVSRQRNWGVPMPFFLHKETGEPHPRTLELIEAVAKRVEQAGIEAGSASTPRNCSATKPASTTR
jgi:isoleucyl-tRNA synthetase